MNVDAGKVVDNLATKLAEKEKYAAVLEVQLADLMSKFEELESTVEKAQCKEGENDAK